MGEVASNIGLGRMHVIRPTKSNIKYLSSQSGLMTYMSHDCGIWDQTGRYPGLEEILLNWTVEGILTKGIYCEKPKQLENQKK